MADIADVAGEVEEAMREAAIQNAHRKYATFPFIGRCYFCDEAVSHGAFCDAGCRDDYELQQKLRRQNGG